MSSPPETRLHARTTPGQEVPRPASPWRAMFTGWNVIGLALLLGALGVSVWRVNHTAGSLYTDNVSVVRIAHWQLELGYRDALQTTIDRYNRIQAERFARGEIPKRVLVTQLPISERTYGQVINVNLVARTCPDLVEFGMTSLVGGPYRAEFFLNLSTEAEKTNPYNAPPYQREGIDAESSAALPGMRWRETFIDGMTGGFDPDLQGYYSVPTTFAPGGRFAVNLKLLKQATGSDQLPKTLGEMLADCDAMRALGEREHREIWPIAGSSYSKGFWNGYATPFLAESQRRLDIDLDGVITPNEFMAGMRLGLWSFEDPAFGQMIDAVRAIASNYPNGFAAMDRESAMLQFTQEQSGFLYCGAWDVGTVYHLTEKKFPVAVMADVQPGAGDRWGAKPGVNEASMTAACAYGVYKLSPHVDVALDFMRFWTSQAENQRFNEQAEWVPCIVGSKLDPKLAAFAPRCVGLHDASVWLPKWGQGGQLELKLNGLMDAILSGASHYRDHPDSHDEQRKVAQAMRDIAEDPDYGLDVIDHKQDEAGVDAERTAERGIAAQGLAQVLAPLSAAPLGAYRSLVSNQAAGLNGQSYRAVRKCAEGVPR